MAIILVVSEDGDVTGEFRVRPGDNLANRLQADLPNIIRAVNDALLKDEEAG